MRVEYPSVTEPAGAAEPSSAVTQPIPPVTGERCAQCSAPLAGDQRYCLQCGEPRPHLTGPPGSARPPGEMPSSPPRTPPGVTPAAGSQTPARNNSLALLAGIGVLLLAMGVGVLIGRAGAGTTKAPPAQVISLGAAAGAGAGAAGTPGVTTTPAGETPPAESKSKEAKAAESKAKEAKSSGNSISKPAPPTVLKSANSHESRQNFEQKSKNLPNVVSTG